MNVHARWDFETRGGGSTGFGVKVYVWVGLVWAYLGEIMRMRGWSITITSAGQHTWNKRQHSLNLHPVYFAGQHVRDKR